MQAASRKQGACFPAELWEAIEQKALQQKTTRSKVIVEAVRDMVVREKSKPKKGGRK
jgi:metal-responsive CopG/Arc/MetJ family transcriptional regulator